MYLLLIAVGSAILWVFGDISYSIANPKDGFPVDINLIMTGGTPLYESNPLYYWGTKLMFMGLFCAFMGILGTVLTFKKLQLLEPVTNDI